MKNIYILLLVSLLGCAGGKEDDKSNFRFINFASVAVDLYLNGDRYADEFSPGDSTAYDLIDSELVEFTVYEARSFNELGSVSRNIETDTDYSLVSFGSPGDSFISLLRDDNTPPADSRAKLRFINTLPDQAVDIYISENGDTTSTPTVDNLRYRGVSSYREGPVGVIRILAKKKGTDDILVDSGNITLIDGQIWTILVSDTLVFILDRERK